MHLKKGIKGNFIRICGLRATGKGCLVFGIWCLVFRCDRSPATPSGGGADCHWYVRGKEDNYILCISYALLLVVFVRNSYVNIKHAMS